MFHYSLVTFLVLQHAIVLFSLPMFVLMKSVYLCRKHSPSQPEGGRGAVIFYVSQKQALMWVTPGHAKGAE